MLHHNNIFLAAFLFLPSFCVLSCSSSISLASLGTRSSLRARHQVSEGLPGRRASSSLAKPQRASIRPSYPPCIASPMRAVQALFPSIHPSDNLPAYSAKGQSPTPTRGCLFSVLVIAFLTTRNGTGEACCHTCSAAQVRVWCLPDPPRLWTRESKHYLLAPTHPRKSLHPVFLADASPRVVIRGLSIRDRLSLRSHSRESPFDHLPIAVELSRRVSDIGALGDGRFVSDIIHRRLSLQGLQPTTEAATQAASDRRSDLRHNMRY